MALGTRNITHINGLFRVALLNNTDSGVCDEDEQDYSGLYEGTKRRGILLVFEQGQDEGYDGRAKKDQDELVLELLEDELPKRRSWLFGELFRWESLSVKEVKAGMANARTISTVSLRVKSDLVRGKTSLCVNIKVA